GLALTQKGSVLQIAEAIGKAKRPSVVWLHFQDCTGCTETLLRTSAPDVAHLILDVISLDYHETLMAASGAQAEAALKAAVANNAGKHVRSESYRGCGSGFGCVGKTDRGPARLPAKSLQPA